MFARGLPGCVNFLSQTLQLSVRLFFFHELIRHDAVNLTVSLQRNFSVQCEHENGLVSL